MSRAISFPLIVIFPLVLLTACGGSGSDTQEDLSGADEIESSVETDSSGIVDDGTVENDATTDTEPAVDQVDSDNSPDDTSAADDNETSETSNSDNQTETNTGSDVSQDDTDTQTTDNTENTTDTSTSNTDTNTDNGVTEESNVPNTEQPTDVAIGFSNQIPTCEIAGERMLSTLEIGMTELQVLASVGRPLGTGPSGNSWEYGRLGDPSVRFQPLLVDGALVNGSVQGYDTDTSRCDYYQSEKDIPLIEAANSLALSTTQSDFTNEVPTCFDAGVRISALIQFDMTPDQVRSVVGKPVEVDGLGSHWEYGDGTFTPEIWYNSTIENGVFVATTVRGWDGDIRGCD